MKDESVLKLSVFPGSNSEDKVSETWHCRELVCLEGIGSVLGKVGGAKVPPAVELEPE